MGNSISIPEELRQKIETLARIRGVTVDEFVRETLEQSISTARQRDSLFQDTSMFRGDVPTDGSANHDDYLYGDAS